MNKKRLAKISREYFSIFMFFIMIFMTFQNQMAFGDTQCTRRGKEVELCIPSECARTDPKESYNKCREDEYSPTIQNIIDINKNGTLENLALKEGVIPIQCDKNINMSINPIIWMNDDYTYDKVNIYCGLYNIAVTTSYTALSVLASTLCTLPSAASVLNKFDLLRKIAKLAKLKKLYSVAKTVVNMATGLASDVITKEAGGLASSFLFDPAMTLFAESAFDLVSLNFNLLTNIGVQTIAALTPPPKPIPSAIKNIVACSAFIPIITAAPITILATYLGSIYGHARSEIQRTSLCGDDWNNFAYTDPMKSGKFRTYPDYGSFPDSYSYAVKQCINEGKCDESILKKENDGKFCDFKNSNMCDGVKLNTKNFRNRVYREFYYRGKEYTIKNKKLYNNSDLNSCIDPRTELQKGFSSMEQRYYFRGKEAANYACDRFTYRNDLCVTENGVSINDPQICKQLFDAAKECCENRRVLGACVQRHKEGRDKNDMCLRSFGSFQGEKCGFGFMRDYIAVQSSKDPSKICVQSYSLCPFNFNIAGGTEIKDLFCDGNYLTCRQDDNHDKLFNQGNWARRYGNDKPIICEDNVYGECKKPTTAYGSPKNFCTYQAHCTEIGTSDASFIDIPENKFMPEVCSTLRGDSQFFPVNSTGDDGVVYDSKGFVDFNNPLTAAAFKNIDFSLGNYRGFTAPIAQCVKETLDNIFLNRAGQTFCNFEIESTINSFGFCGSDETMKQAQTRQEEYIKNHQEPPYLYIKGAPLEENQNIFFRIQSLMRDLIRVTLVLALVFIAISFLLKGDLDIFDNVKKPKAMIFGAVKFSIVVYFALGNAWQSTFYNYLMRATDFAYNKVFQLSLVNYGDGSYITSEYQAVRLFDFGDTDDIECEKENGRMICTTNTEIGNVRRTLYNYYRLPLASVKEAEKHFSLSRDRVFCSLDGEGEIDCRFFANGCDLACRGIPNDSPQRGVVDPVTKKIEYEYGKKLYIYSQKYDGCFFGDNVYPQGKAYLGIFDTLDCKLSSYFDYGPNVDLPGILQMLIVSLIFSPLLIMIVVLGFVLFILLLSIAIKLMMMFLMAFIAINLFVYVSPIIFPLMLIPRTKSMFDKWITNLMGYCLQIIFVCAFIGFFIGSIDRFGVGSARFVGHDINGRLPTTVCDVPYIDAFEGLVVSLGKTAVDGAELVFREGAAYIKYPDGYKLLTSQTNLDDLEGDIKEIIKEANRMFESASPRDSIVCIFNISTNISETQPVLGEVLYKYFGLGPLISGVSSIITFNPIQKTATNAIEVGFTIVKFVLMMYVCLQVLKKIPEISSEIFGGKKINYGGKLTDPKEMMSNMITATKVGSKVASGAAGKAVKTAQGAVGTARNAAGAVRGGIRSVVDARKKEKEE